MDKLKVENTSEVQQNVVEQPVVQDSNASPAVNDSNQMNEQSSKQKVKIISPQIQKIKYPVCNKGNFHEGELLNYVYLNTTSKDDVLGCAVCQEENKKGHWKPLKIVLHQALENSTKQQSSQLNSDEVLTYLQDQRDKAEKQLNEMYESFSEKIVAIKSSVFAFFDKMKDQVLSHSSANHAINDLFNNVYDFNEDIDLLKSAVQRLVNFIPQEEQHIHIFIVNLMFFSTAMLILALYELFQQGEFE